MALKHQDQTRRPETRRTADRASRFIARVDAHLPTLADDGERRAFLDRQLDEYRYACFIAAEGASEFTASRADPPQAADFLLTITSLAARRIALGRDAKADDHG